MAKIIWNNNGQGEFDFEYLLKITSEEFVKRFEQVFDIANDETSFRKVLRVIVDEFASAGSVDVYIINDTTVSILTYNRYSNDINVVVLGKDNLIDILDVMDQ